MPSAQLRALVISLIEPIDDPALAPRIADPSIAIGTRCDADDITSAGARGDRFVVEGTPVEISAGHSVPIGVVNGVSLGEVELAAPLDSGPSIRTHGHLDTVSDNASRVVPHGAIDRALDDALDSALVALDALDDAIDLAIDLAIDDAVDGDLDDGLDDFEAQPTAYRVRSATLDDVIAAVAPR